MAATDVDILSARAEWAGVGSFLNDASSIATAFGLIGDRADEAGRKQLASGLAAGAGAAAIVGFLGKAAVAAGEDEAAFARAANSFRAAGNSFPTDELEEFTGALGRQVGISDDAIAGTVGLLGTFRLTKEQAEQLTPAILDTAEALKAQGVSAEGLAVQVGKALESGKTEGLRRVGIIIDPAEVARVGVFAAVIDGLRKNGEGAAAVFRGTLPGALQAARTAAGEFTEEIGKNVAPILNAGADAVARVTNLLQGIPGAGAVAATALGAGALALGYYSAQTLIAFRQTVLYTAALANQAAAARGAAAANAQNAVATAAAGNAAGGAAASQVAGGIGGLAGRFGGGFAGMAAGGFIIDATKGHGTTAEGLGRIGGETLEGAGAGFTVGGLPGALAGALGGFIKGNVDAIRLDGESKQQAGQKAKDPQQAALDKIAGHLANIDRNTSKGVGSPAVERLIGLGRARRELMRDLG